jgi:DedD protein
VDNLVKQRVIGAVVLVALAVIFIPMLLESPEEELGPVGSNLPDRPEMSVHDRIEPLTLPEPPPESDPAQMVLEPPVDGLAAGDAGSAEAPQAPATEAAPAPMVPAEPATPPVAETPVEPPPVATAPPAAPPAAAPAPEPAPEPAPVPAKPLSGWVVQLAALSNKDNAMALRERLRGLGYTAFVEETKTAQGTQFRVRVGPELERSNADNLRTRLEQQVQIKGIVMRYP